MPPAINVSIVFFISAEPVLISSFTNPFELESAQYVLYFFSSRKLIIDHGLYISLLSPNVNPSYHNFTFSFSLESPCSSSAAKTSSSVKPKQLEYSSLVTVITFKLLRSENILSLDTLVIPVIIARSKYGFVLKVELKRLLVNPTSSSQYPFTYASCIGVSYSSNNIITFLP